MYKRFITKRFNLSSLELIEKANEILEEYASQGFVLTLRQLYYQFVARDYLPNRQREYKRLGSVIGDARLAGLVDWDMIEDRTRSLRRLTSFEGPEEALRRLSQWYHIDLWQGQEIRPEVWIEKDALAGVIARVCDELDVSYFSCRGYTSISEMYETAKRFHKYNQEGSTPYLIHLGDHDPSGVDMSRDIEDRLKDTFGSSFIMDRVALNMDQIEALSPPPNPAKATDSRYPSYEEEWGEESWELDALEPSYLDSLIRSKIEVLREDSLYFKRVRLRDRVKKELEKLAGNYNKIKKVIKLRKQVLE